ncbi:MAG: DUF2088 domain-containing protein [Phycisphaerales bacterium]|nr:MAG: DUF2088 domain-containing protein [Phycisphaerales bacterium]
MNNPSNLKWEAVGPLPVAEVRSSEEILSDAFNDSGVLGSFLDDAATKKESVLLVINDAHRFTRTREALAALAGFVKRRHRPSARFRALIAAGTHCFSEAQRREFEVATFHDCALDIQEVAWHEATIPTDLVDCAGVRMHRCVADSKFLLPIGSVEPHYFAGATGAHKTVTIGCMAHEDIERNHACALSPRSNIARLDGNPVHEGIVTILHALESTGKRILAINEIVRDHILIAAALGHPLDTLHALMSTVVDVYIQRVAQPVDLLHLKVPMPLGCNLYQADKALKNNHLAVRDGGGILLEAACPEGIGPDAFLTLLRRAGDYESAARVVEAEGYRLGDHKAVKLRYLTDPTKRGVNVALVSSCIALADARAAGMEIFTDNASALDWLVGNSTGPVSRGLVVEDAGCVSATAGPS